MRRWLVSRLQSLIPFICLFLQSLTVIQTNLYTDAKHSELQSLLLLLSQNILRELGVKK